MCQKLDDVDQDAPIVPQLATALPVSTAIDRAALNQVVFNGVNTVACSPVSPKTESSSPLGVERCPTEVPLLRDRQPPGSGRGGHRVASHLVAEDGTPPDARSAVRSGVEGPDGTPTRIQDERTA